MVQREERGKYRDGQTWSRWKRESWPRDGWWWWCCCCWKQLTSHIMSLTLMERRKDSWWPVYFHHSLLYLLLQSLPSLSVSMCKYQNIAENGCSSWWARLCYYHLPFATFATHRSFSGVHVSHSLSPSFMSTLEIVWLKPWETGKEGQKVHRHFWIAGIEWEKRVHIYFFYC